MLTKAFRKYSEKVTFSRQRKLNNAECIVQIKREISLAKVCLTCKHHATFFENHELSRAAFKSSKYGKHTHNPQFLQSLWRRANARSVSFETIDGGQFTLSTQLIRLKDHIKVKLTIWIIKSWSYKKSNWQYKMSHYLTVLIQIIYLWAEHI